MTKRVTEKSIDAGNPLNQILAQKFSEVRAFSEYLTDPLEAEDYVVQTMTEASPAKWHLAHTSWFFETFVLAKAIPDYKLFHPQFHYLFNSYYEQAGKRHARPKRGLLSRPTVKEIFSYRRHVDKHILEYLEETKSRSADSILSIIELGLEHERQHQELILTDIKHVFSQNPLLPAYRAKKTPEQPSNSVKKLGWVSFPGGIHEIGHDGSEFAFDNERPRHKVYLEPFLIADRLVTNGEYLEFMKAGGYEKPEFWLSDGWADVQAHGWNAPLYWEKDGGKWRQFTLRGMKNLDFNEPVCHVSFYESDAYARWKNVRLATEAEWEIAASALSLEGNFVEDEQYHPACLQNSGSDTKLSQMLGTVWEWTGSPYTPYPGFKPLAGALGEYNGKFMCNQMVLRGGSCATSKFHIRKSYRNFFPPASRWQFSGIRLANDS